MGFVYKEYAALYPDGPEERTFERLAWEARRIMDRAATGVDGVRKLKQAPPVEALAAEAVRRCEAELVRRLWMAEQESGRVCRPDGTVSGKVVTALSAGSESVSFAQPKGGAVSPAEREAVCREIVETYLAGVADANGVNLLYMGRYPVKHEKPGEE